MAYLMIFITAIFVNNIILSQFLGICPFLGVSKKLSTAVGMGLAVMFVMTLATIVTFLIYYTFLQPYNLKFMTTVAFILVIASLVQMVEIIIKKKFSGVVSVSGNFFTADYHQLRCFGHCHSDDSKELYAVGRHLLYSCFSHGIYIGNRHFCRHSRALGTHGNSRGSPWHADCADFSGSVVNGLYGLCRYRLLSKIKDKI